MNYAQIDEAVAEICRILELHPGGYSDDVGKSSIKAQCRLIEDSGASMGYFAEKLGSIREHADALYSARKHRQFNGGAEQLRVWIMGDSDSIRRQADQFRRKEL